MEAAKDLEPTTHTGRKIEKLRKVAGLSLSVATKISKTLGVSLDYLVGNTDSELGICRYPFQNSSS